MHSYNNKICAPSPWQRQFKCLSEFKFRQKSKWIITPVVIDRVTEKNVCAFLLKTTQGCLQQIQRQYLQAKNRKYVKRNYIFY